MMSRVASLDPDKMRLHASLLARSGRGIGKLVRFIAAVLACLTPVTALFVLGALQQLMRRVGTQQIEKLGDHLIRRPHADPTADVLSASDRLRSGRLKRAIDTLRQYFVEGCQAAFSLAIATLPFSLLWLFSWWAGWENSFNKGYEQSWVGPSLGLLGVFVALNVLIYVPMGLAHQAMEHRWQSFFHIRRVVSLIDCAGWRYVALAGLTAVAGLPLFAAQGLPVFIENIRPGFEHFTAEQVKEVAGQFKLLAAIYVVVALVILRWLAARLYARALGPAVRRHAQLWAASGYEVRGSEPMRGAAGRSWMRQIGRIVRIGLLWVILFGLVAQIFVAQFLNYQWWNWLTHPFYLLPWVR